MADEPIGFDVWLGHPDLKEAARLLRQCQLGNGGHEFMIECYRTLNTMIADIINWRKIEALAAGAILNCREELLTVLRERDALKAELEKRDA